MKAKYLRKRYQLKQRNKKDLPIIYLNRTNKYINGQCFSDGKIMAFSSDKKLDNKKTKLEKSEIAGKELGKKLKQNNIKDCIFDLKGKKFFGRIKNYVLGVKSEL